GEHGWLGQHSSSPGEPFCAGLPKAISWADVARQFAAISVSEPSGEVPTLCLRPWAEAIRSAPPPSRPLRDPPRRCSSSSSSSSSRRHLYMHWYRYRQHPRQRRSLRSPPPLPEALFPSRTPCFQPLDLRWRWRARWRRRARWRS
ncbi:unnamed protein product, partial [Scytosiphon promiscuus]